ncbi:MAG: flagellar hook-basal body complex protein FliE [Planctomycetes bacterium]|nr:flagellar hook-basal body complex protein FliE [Planctomycetota bacterium]
MSVINPIPGGSIPRLAPLAGVPSGQQQVQKNDFSSAMKNMVSSADRAQQQSASAISDLLAGRTDDILPVVNAVAKADLSFKLLLGVRNKVIEAYKQTMNMQV